jgi:hypothetical protein
MNGKKDYLKYKIKYLKNQFLKIKLHIFNKIKIIFFYFNFFS